MMKTIFRNQDAAIEKVEEGLFRQVLGYDSDIMLVRAIFDEGKVAPRHSHPHQQVTYVEKGKFMVEIEGEWTELNEGDSFVIPSNAMHHGKALTECVLIDTFSPMREDFI